MFTYQMVIVNGDNCQKIVMVSGETFLDAVSRMRTEHGREWSVFSSKLVSAN